MVRFISSTLTTQAEAGVSPPAPSPNTHQPAHSGLFLGDDMTAANTTEANPLAITKDRVKAWSACHDGYRWFLEKFPQGGDFAEVYGALQADKRYEDSGWLADKVFAELDAPNIVQQTVRIAGADKAKIEQAAKDAGTADGVTATTGEGANASTTGDWANAATTGEGANAATTGDWANAATTGYRANAATTGYRANAATTGNWANAATTGDRAIAACLGLDGKAKAGPSGCVIVAYLDATNRPRVCVGYVGEADIKADTWYRAEGGKLVEAEDER